MESFIASVEKFSGHLAEAVWGLPLVFTLFGAGLLFTIYFGFPQFRLFKHAIDVTAGKFDKPEDKGEITHFQALCAALSATIGLGNIAGVAVAISLGGPGAIFWMWVAGILGMATKFTSISLALLHREVKDDGTVHGGPMFTIRNGMGKKFYFMAAIYAVFLIFSTLGPGNLFQSNQMASILATKAGIPKWISGLAFMAMSWLVLVGGIKRIGSVAGKLVPTMVVIYFFGALGIVFANWELVPDVITSIFHDAFYGTAAVGGFVGIGFKEVVVHGVRRAVFSNEAGMGSAAMAHCAAKSKPVQEGIVGLLGPFIDTIVVCTLTAVVMLVTGVWSNTGGLEGSELTARAFETLYGPFGGWMITISVVLFAFSTIISWSYYGEQGVVYLFGKKGIPYFKYVFIGCIMIGALAELKVVLNFSDAVFGLLAVPNLICNVFLSKKLKGELASYMADLKAGNL